MAAGAWANESTRKHQWNNNARGYDKEKEKGRTGDGDTRGSEMRKSGDGQGGRTTRREFGEGLCSAEE